MAEFFCFFELEPTRSCELVTRSNLGSMGTIKDQGSPKPQAKPIAFVLVKRVFLRKILVLVRCRARAR